jgi:hypothetical protein
VSMNRKVLSQLARLGESEQWVRHTPQALYGELREVAPERVRKCNEHSLWPRSLDGRSSGGDR